jgi:hypothetical protein
MELLAKLFVNDAAPRPIASGLVISEAGGPAFRLKRPFFPFDGRADPAAVADSA